MRRNVHEANRRKENNRQDDPEVKDCYFASSCSWTFNAPAEKLKLPRSLSNTNTVKHGGVVSLQSLVVVYSPLVVLLDATSNLLLCRAFPLGPPLGGSL